MSHSQQLKTADGLCTLCPACCPVGVAAIGPDLWAPEVPLANVGGACPKGTALAQLLVHRSRILATAQRRDGCPVPVSMANALAGILAAAGDGAIHLLVDGNVPVEQMVEAAAWCRVWDQAKLCLVVEPAEEQLLEGLEAGEATYLAPEALAGCDGFVIVGNAFAANPTCSRAVFDRRAVESRTPIIVVDSAGGTAAKFATHLVTTPPGAELTAMAAVARAAGVATADIVEAGGDLPGADVAGRALANCKRLGILIAAEFGRTGHWRQIGYLAAKMAAAFGGGVAPQTTGANALAAVRLAQQLGTISLAEAIADDAATCVVIGCDVRGMLGRPDFVPLAAAAPLPNESTETAEFTLPVAMPGELSGTYCPPGAKGRPVSAALPIPAGIPTPAGVGAALAGAAGVSPPPDAPTVDMDRRATVDVPAVKPETPCSTMALLLGRRSGAAGSGALTSHGPWQQATEPTPTLRVSPADAASLAISHLACVTVTGGVGSVAARAMISPELSPGAVVLPEGLAATRGLLGCEVDVDGQMILTCPVAAALTCENENDHDGDR